MEIYSLKDSPTPKKAKRLKAPKSLGHFELSFPEEESVEEKLSTEPEGLEIFGLDGKKDSIGGHEVTDIKQAVKDQNRVNIFIDGKFDFSLDVAQVVDFKIKVGRKLTAAELEEYRSASEFGKLYQRTLEWVISRPHSIRETRDYLTRKRMKRISENKMIVKNKERSKEDCKKYKLRTKEMPIFSDDEIEMVITRLCEHGYLDDEKYAAFFVENRFAKKGVSRRRLEQELRLKGIDQDIIENVLENTTRNDDEEIMKMIEKKRKKYTDEKLIAYLVRQGFDYQRAKAAVLGTD